jgi:transposase
LEATTNSDAIATMLRPLVRRVVVSTPRKTRAIAEAKVKTDKVDARILAQLLAADFLPETWVADDRTRMLRRLVMRRTHLVKQRTRLKNQVHAILARNLVATCPHADLFSGVGRRWPAAQDLPAERRWGGGRQAVVAQRLSRNRQEASTAPRHSAGIISATTARSVREGRSHDVERGTC